MIRQAGWAGSFYDYEPAALRKSITECFLGSLGPGRIPEAPAKRVGNVLGIVSPHAGYPYSGPGAANAFCALAEDGLPQTAVIIGPKHRYPGAEVAIDTSEAWSTPLGMVKVDREVCERIVDRCDCAEADSMAHLQEHSLEVQIPFLQFIAADGISIVPIAIGLAPRGETMKISRDLGRAIAESVTGKEVVVIASTDFTHYEPQKSAEKKDALAIAAVEKLDSELLLDTVNAHGITMCGVVPTAIAIEVCKALGANRAELLSYFTSGEMTGDSSSVVGYGALKIMKS